MKRLDRERERVCNCQVVDCLVSSLCHLVCLLKETVERERVSSINSLVCLQKTKGEADQGSRNIDHKIQRDRGGDKFGGSWARD